MLSRGTDDALGTNMSGARPEHERGTGLGAGHGTSDLDAALTPGDQGERGTMLSRGIDDALGTNLSGARPGNETGGTGRSGFGSDHSAASDASAAMTPGDQGEPGTALSRGVDDALGTNISGAGTGSAAGGAGRDDEAIPVVEERLRVGKREVTHGRVRVRTYVVETPVEEQVRLREEHVRVDRHAVDRPVTDADRLFRERTVEATETSEEAVIAKEARVTEELRLQKEASERTETVRDTVRRTEVEVDNDVSPTAPLPPGGAGGTDPTRRNI
ncbi:MAG: YsnF/AvaK domain-containing protein [Acetobacteraceae bacterium]|nr:YsnF/AvaK domain-containing protein [Acetobacteraceae bacterium]